MSIKGTPKYSKTLRYTKLLKYSFTGVNSNLKNFESLDF